MRVAPFVSRFVLGAAMALLAGRASAQEGILAGMQKNVDTVFTSVSTTTTFPTGAVLKTQTTDASPALRLNVNTMVFPNIQLTAGGVFEIDRVSRNGTGTESVSTLGRNRPYFLLRSINPVLSPGFGFFRREERARTTGFSDVKLVNNEYAAYLGWNPAGGPRSDFQFLKTDTFDAARVFQNSSRRFGSLVSNYVRGRFAADYRGTIIDTTDKLQGITSWQRSQGARVAYSDSYLQKRLLWNATYNLNHDNVRTAVTGRGVGDVAIPVPAFAGLAVLTDTPITATLSPNAALIDGTLTTGSGINIGLSVPPADLQARNIGLDFVNPTTVNRLWIWVDRELPLEIAASFSWDIYTSPDNLVWTRQANVGNAPFGPFENHFQVDFPGVTARYIKAVTRPLSPAVRDSARFPDILVTEVQAFITRPAGQRTASLVQTTHVVDADVRFRILNAPSLFYEGYYLYNGPGSFGRSTHTLSNGFSVNQTFARIFSAYGRGAREQGTEPRGSRVANVANATLTVEPIPGFRSSLLYTGQDEQVGGLPRSRNGFFVQNAGQPYHGVDVLVGFGWNVNNRETGESSHDRLVNATANVVPHEHLTLTLNYDARTSRRSGIFVGAADLRTQRMYGAVAVDPLSTLHLVLGEEVLSITGQRTRTTLDVGVNWAPFRDGTLQFVFASNQALRDLEFGRDRNTMGGVRWNVTRRSYLDVSYQRTRSELVFVTTESRIVSVSLRMFF